LGAMLFLFPHKKKHRAQGALLQKTGAAAAA
jgi:hypothetical protein